MIFKKNNYYRIPRWRKPVKVLIIAAIILIMFFAGFFLGELAVLIFR